MPFFVCQPFVCLVVICILFNGKNQVLNCIDFSNWKYVGMCCLGFLYLQIIIFGLSFLQTGSSTSASTSTAGVKIPTCKFSLTDRFRTAPEELYRVFVHPEVRSTLMVVLLWWPEMKASYPAALVLYQVDDVCCFTDTDGASIHTCRCSRGKPERREVPAPGRECVWGVCWAGKERRWLLKEGHAHVLIAPSEPFQLNRSTHSLLPDGYAD